MRTWYAGGSRRVPPALCLPPPLRAARTPTAHVPACLQGVLFSLLTLAAAALMGMVFVTRFIDTL